MSEYVASQDSSGLARFTAGVAVLAICLILFVLALPSMFEKEVENNNSEQEQTSLHLIAKKEEGLSLLKLEDEVGLGGESKKRLDAILREMPGLREQYEKQKVPKQVHVKRGGESERQKSDLQFAEQRAKALAQSWSNKYALPNLTIARLDQAKAVFDSSASNFQTPAERFCYLCWFCTDPALYSQSDLNLLDFAVEGLATDEVRRRIQFGIELFKEAKPLYYADAAVVHAGGAPYIFHPGKVSTVLGPAQRKTYQLYLEVLKQHSDLWDTVKEIAI